MTANPARILVYGDSNTAGFSLQYPSGFLPRPMIWPSVLADILGKNCQVLAAGLCGRMLDAGAGGLNGAEDIARAMTARLPLALAVIMLGTNDLLAGSPPARIAAGAGRILCNAGAVLSPEKLALAAPPAMDPAKLGWKPPALAPILAEAARSLGAHFIDAEQIMAGAPDGVHLTRENHQALARLVAEEVLLWGYYTFVFKFILIFQSIAKKIVD